MQGPVAVAINAIPAFYNYGGGILPASACPPGDAYDHAILVVGYDRVKKFWRIQNSW